MTSGWKPRTLILQHEATTPPGLMHGWLADQEARVEILRIDEEQREVRVRDYDLIVSLGSEYAAFDDSIPFVPREARLLQEALHADVPILGLCFGGQMLARALGSHNSRSEQAEIGWVQVRTHEPDIVSAGPWFQWHFDTFTPPPGATVIAETDAAVQAFVAGRSLGLQFHPEVTPDIVAGWVKAYPRELESEGVDSSELLAETLKRAPEAKQSTWRLLNEFRDRIALGRHRKEADASPR
jgi:GMP synthase-like glutamine amidotransferase